MAYTPQQQMGYEAYSVPCRIGNWCEDEYNHALHTKSHLEKAQSGTLTMSKLNSTLGVDTSPAEISTAGEGDVVKFGDVVVLSSALGGAIAANHRHRLPVTQELYQVVRGADASPQQRTAWRIAPAGEAPADGVLRFGALFQLVATGASEPLYLSAQRYTLANACYSSSVRGAERKNGVALAGESSYLSTYWKVAPLNPNPVEQLDLDKTPVPVNLFVAFVHCGTCIKLCTDTTTERTEYGAECMVSLFTDTEIAKAEWGVRDSKGVGAGNHFAFSYSAAP